MTDRQKQFYRLYRKGYSLGMIAIKHKVSKSTVYRTVSRAEKNIRDAERLVAEMKREGLEVDHADFSD